MTRNFKAQKIRKLLFFPSSLPDETLFSRLSRYNMLYGKDDDYETFVELFGDDATEMDFDAAAPYALKGLARRLPGQPRITLGNLLAENCFLALVIPIIATPEWEHSDPVFGECNICLACAIEDRLTGIPYVRRSHQLPGVKACWIHSTKLVDACPACSAHFRQPLKFLTVPMQPCICGWHPLMEKRGHRASWQDQKFSLEAHRVFERRVLKTPTSTLTSFFEMHIDHSSFRRHPYTRTESTDLAISIAEHFEKKRSTFEIASAVSRYIHSGGAPDCWVANLNPQILAKRAQLRDKD